MAVELTCPRCKERFRVSASRLGQPIECERCGQRFLSQSREEILQREARQLRQEPEDPDRERLDLIERMDQRRRTATSTYSDHYGIGPRRVRHFNPDAPSRYLRFRALSEALLLCAYVVLLLVAVGAGATIYLRISGVISSLAVLMVCLVGWVILGAIAYVGLKMAGELAFLLSDLGDQQRDVVRLLLDLRENTDAAEKAERAAD